MNLSYLLFATTIFLSAFLLFQVQPIISKYILPWFGGTSAVWTTAMLFFQTFLLLGYAYILLLAKWSLKKQIVLHAVLVLVITGILLFLFGTWKAPILPGIGFKLSDSYSPIVQVLVLLTVSVGLPYFLLSTTSVLLQKWFGMTATTKSPYPLYALSNAASLLALLSYPILIEPFLPLQQQGFLWGVGFVAYGVTLVLCCLRMFFAHATTVPKQKATAVVITKRSISIWLFLSATATMMFLAVTTLLTQSVAPIPFLWILPLSIYLLSFILCFSGAHWYWRNVYAYLFAVTAPWLLIFSLSTVPSVWFGIVVCSLALFSACMLCHGELYQRKPAPVYLDRYYVFIALGSVISGVFVGIIAPLVFRGFWEIYIAVYLAFFVAIVALVHYKQSFVYRHYRRFFLSEREVYACLGIGFPVVVIMLGFVITFLSQYKLVGSWRDFYGVVDVKERSTPHGKLSVLFHGNIIHGVQYATGPKRYRANSYYGDGTGVRDAIVYAKRKNNISVGVLGLGVGTLAAFGRKGDIYTFYEISQQVVDIAHDKFTYLKDTPAKTEIIVGDGRLAMAKETNPRKFDVIVLDAFSGDAIPVHLLTKEAFELYLTRLNPDGIIAVNITNNYVNLKPLLVQVAHAFDLEYAFIYTPRMADTYAAEWGLLTRDKAALQSSVIQRTKQHGSYPSVSLWTDDYSNLFQLLK